MTQTIDCDATEPRLSSKPGPRRARQDTNPGKTHHSGTPVFVGYARVSTHHQAVDRQVDALREAGCGRIFVDHGVTGMTMDRQELQAALTWMRRGDVLTIVSLDRLGRSVRGVLALVDDLEERGVGLRVLQLGLDTSTPSGRLVLTVLLAVAQLERDHLSENQIRAVRAMRSDGASIAECAEAFEVSTRTITRALTTR